MERQPRAQNRGDDDFIVVERYLGFAERRLDHAGCVVEPLRDFVGHDFADAFQIPTEAHRVALDFVIADFGDELVEYGVLLVQNVDLHNLAVLGS